MKQLVSDTVYNDLKERGLELSIPSTLIIPESTQPVPSLLSKLGYMLTKQKQKPACDKIIPFPILGSALIVARKYNAFVYSYKIDDETSELHIEHKQVIRLQYPIIGIYSCDRRFATDKGQIPIVFATQYGIIYCSYDFKTEQLIQKNYIKLQYRILAIQWVTDHECMIINEDGSVQNYTITLGLLKLINTIKINFNETKGKIVRKGWILSNIDEQQLSTISLFYVMTASLQQGQKMSLHVKQFIRNLSGEIQLEEQPDFYIQTNNLIYSEQFFINGVGDYYCMKANRQVVVIKKKFNKYMILDNMGEKIDNYTMYLSDKGLLLSLGKNVIQLNSIHFSDPKCNLRMCDIIDIPENIQKYQEYYYNVWPITMNKQYSLIFVFLVDNKVILSHLVKIQAMIKMMNKANQTPKQKLNIVKDLAQNLGIPRKNFYLKLWTKSKKQKADIEQYLIPCNDIPSIKKQLLSTLKKRTIPVSQMTKILQKISQIISQNLRQNLTQINIRQYVKNDFLRRKLKMEQVNKQLDHRIFQKIYSSSLQTLFWDIVSQQIDPVQIKMDPLHAMLDQTPYKQLKSLQMVFQQFKLIILQDYKEFLIQFLQKFPKKTLQILENFSFLLPMHPFTINVQKPSKTNQPAISNKTRKQTQPLWFQQISVKQWQSQMTKQRIIKQFYDYYATSSIMESVKDFTYSLYGKQNKRGKHGLITLSLEQYTKKVKTLEGISLYLQICQYANLRVVAHPQEDPKMSLNILQILQKQNNLNGSDLKICQIYAAMHYFMLKNKVIEQQKFSILDLIQLKPEDLVALFFLENKQKEEYIFSDFMDLYEDKFQFIAILESFIKSENCSRIQLQILIKDVASKGKTFQQNNQQVIELLIAGLCMKFQICENMTILEKDEDSDFPKSSLIQRISLSQKLALKINRIKQLSHCRTIFLNFKCDKMTYNQILQLEQDNGIFKLLLQKYFNDEIRENQIKINIDEHESQEEQHNVPAEIIKIQSPLSMLWVLLWLQQRVFYGIKKQDFVQVYAQILLEWKQFQIIRTIIYQVSKNGRTILQQLQIDPEQFKNELILRSLDLIYLDSEILYDSETKQQIISILNIDKGTSAMKICQLAKLQLVDIFQKWGCPVRASDIHQIFFQWKENNKRQFIEFLLEKYIGKLDYACFVKIYTQLQISVQQTTDVDIYNEQFADYAILYAFKLLQKGRYQEILQILSFIKQLKTVPISFGLQSETFLKNISQLYKDQLDIGKKMIEYYCQNNTPERDYNIKRLYDSNFNSDILQFWEREDSIVVNDKFLYNKAPYTCHYKLDQLWDMAYATIKTEQIYYCYYFLIMGLTKIQTGLTKIHKISYNLDYLTDLLLGIQNYNNNRKYFWIVDFDYLLRKYLEGLIGEALSRLDVGVEIAGFNKLQTVLSLLKENKQKNQILVKSLSRINQQMKSKLKRTERKKRFLRLLNERAIQLAQKQKIQNQLELQNKDKQPSVIQHPGIFMNWKQINDKKRTITKTESHIFDSEKQLIDHIFENYEPSPAKFHKQPIRSGVLNNLFMPSVGDSQKINLLMDLIRDGQLQRVAVYPDQLIVEGIRKILGQDENTDLYKIMDVMDYKDIGDKQKREIFKLTKYFKGEISNQLMNKIFDVDFFMRPLDASQEEKYVKIYGQLRPRIIIATKELPAQSLKDVAHMFGHILQSSQFSSLVYYDILLDFAANAKTFDSHTAFMAQQCVAGLGEYTDIIVNRYQQLLKAFTNQRQLKLYVRENLSKIMHQKGYNDIAKAIKLL